MGASNSRRATGKRARATRTRTRAAAEVAPPQPPPTSRLAVDPEALEDLRRSGLSDGTIAAAGLFTPAPADLPRFLSARLVGQVRHVLVFPYRDGQTDGAQRRHDEFVR